MVLTCSSRMLTVVNLGGSLVSGGYCSVGDLMVFADLLKYIIKTNLIGVYCIPFSRSTSEPSSYKSIVQCCFWEFAHF
jgi:hypothetical protein